MDRLSVRRQVREGDVIAVEVFPSGVRDKIRADYLGLLRANGSPLLENPGIHSQLVGQLDSVLDAVAPILEWRVERVSGLDLSADIGDARARSGASPAQSLKAASLIFHAALPAVTDRLRQLGDADAAHRAAVALNTAILDRMATAAMSYVEVLLSVAHTNAHVERVRLSRELHDVTAPNVALALQSLELHDVYRRDSPDRATGKLADARISLHRALTLLRSTAGELRHDVAATGLAESLRRYIDSLGVGSAVALQIHDPRQLDNLSAAYCEEAFLIVREALRNATTHAHATHIEVTITARDDTLEASIVDDGQGFDQDAAVRDDNGVGLASMRERAELLSATLRVQSSAQAGTTVRLTVPLPHRPTAAAAVRRES